MRRFADIRQLVDLTQTTSLQVLVGNPVVSCNGSWLTCSCLVCRLLCGCCSLVQAAGSCTVIDGAALHTGLHTYVYYDTCPYDLSQ